MAHTVLEQFQTERAGKPLTALTADVVAYLDHPMSQHKDEVLRALDRFYELLPRDTLGWYSTETMSKDKPATKRTFDIPRAWWRDGAKLAQLRYLQMHDGETYNAVPHAGLRLKCNEIEPGDERPWNPSLIRFMFPAHWGEERPQDMIGMARSLVDTLPIVSGHGGYCIERNAYYEEASIRSAFPLGMRYQGADIDYRVCRFEFDHLKAVNWLTLVGARLLERLGWKPALRRQLEGAGVLVHEVKFGVVLQAGDLPSLGDVNRGDSLDAYRAVYRVVSPLFAPELTPPFDLGRGNDAELTDTWYRRFGSSPHDAF
jgi:hypothetical protein